ncbi:hypothetical protein TorRG33x02_307950 [Trema orientale]|uniref:Uncharacterized protein n=1 Tax=Trema orientale TaxID=63057 RepID=A0A2P5BV13_TREOI|nr:hypothetical protein TorRG33x02_307950 [Trema orientale]
MVAEEAVAALAAIQLALDCCYEAIILLRGGLSSQQCWTWLFLGDYVLSNGLRLLESVADWSCFWVHRSINFAAHNLVLWSSSKKDTGYLHGACIPCSVFHDTVLWSL